MCSRVPALYRATIRGRPWGGCGKFQRGTNHHFLSCTLQGLGEGGLGNTTANVAVDPVLVFVVFHICLLLAPFLSVAIAGAGYVLVHALIGMTEQRATDFPDNVHYGLIFVRVSY